MARQQRYYMQRGYVCNDISWWANDQKISTVDIRLAHLFTLEEALRFSKRHTDRLWPKEYIEQRISHHVDTEHCDLEKACIRMDRVQKGERLLPPKADASPCPCIPPKGKPLLPCQFRADTVKRIKQLRKKKARYKEIADLFNATGVPTFSGNGRWHAQSIHRLAQKEK